MPNIHVRAYISNYIYSHPQTDLFHSIRTLQSGQTGKIPEAEIETRLTQTPIQDSTIQPRGDKRKRRKFKRLCITFVFVYIYPLNGYRELDSYEESCITLVTNLLLPWLESSILQGLGSIYIVMHRQICFVLSELIYIYI